MQSAASRSRVSFGASALRSVRTAISAGLGLLTAVAAAAGGSPVDIPAEWQRGAAQSIQDSEYHFSLHEDGRYQAPNRAHDLRIKIDDAGLVVTSRTRGESEAEGGFSLDLTLVAWGRQGAIQKVNRAVCSPRNERIDLDRGALVEWYVNTSAGLEQGFTIPAPPSRIAKGRDPGARRQPLLLEFEIAGLGAYPSEDGQEVMFKNGAGVSLVRYAGLHAIDARGDIVAARLQFDLGRFRIVIDDGDSVYPLTVDPLLTSPAWTTEGDQADDDFASSVATAGDVNGDGFSDVIIGAYRYDNGQPDEGRAFVFLGSAAGLASEPAWMAEGNQVNAWFGYSVATAADVNGDGYDDVIVGASQYSNGESAEGRAFVFHGSAAGPTTGPSWTAEGNQTDAVFGNSVATAGDVNGDGFGDVIVGAFFYDNDQLNEGRAYVYHGSASGLAASPAWMDEGDQEDAIFGSPVSTAGDVNGDGYGDVIVGAYLFTNNEAYEGRAFVYHGSASGLSTNPVWTAESNQADAYFGYSVSTAGDVNGDGYADVTVGAIFYSNGKGAVGSAFTYHGSASGLSASPAWTVVGDQDGARLGNSLAAAGDVNGDGYSDIVVGAYFFDNGESNEGRTYIYQGSSAGLGTTPAWTAESDQSNARFGYSVATAGDVNGDGYSDVIVGASFFTNDQLNEGRAFVYYGAASGLTNGSAWAAEGEQADAEYGRSVASAGDVNGDGYSDLIVGAHLYDNGGLNEGRVFVYLGSATGVSATPSWTAEADQADARFGFSVGSAGDVNGDGYADVVVGAVFFDNGQSNEGRAFVYLGSAAGLAPGAAWTAESNQADAWFGFSVATAGDVNGDGYSDVIVGANQYDNGESNEGRTFVYLGSGLGLSSTPAWTAESDQANSRSGGSAATAGDVNRDGYSDVIVGALQYGNGQANEGRAYVYLGSAAGVATSANWVAESDQAGASFGSSVATAGDVNGDGFADVIVGASNYTNGASGEGRAVVYLGTLTGPAPMPSWAAEGNLASARFGYSVGSAGDVNGDGFADVIVGAYNYANGQLDEGGAFVYHGAASGLQTTTGWITESNQGGARLGISVASAGDVDGDGFSDVVAGAHVADNGQANEGRAFVYHGNGGGLNRIARQARADGTGPIAPFGKSDAQSAFRLRALGRTPAGRGKVRLQWERKLLGQTFDGTGMAQGSLASGTGFPSGGGSAVALEEALASVPADSVHHWRLRILTDSPFFPRSPWLTLPHNGSNEADLRTTGNVSPQVIDVTPPNNAEDVASGANVVVRFSEDIRASTITAATFRLLDDATPIPATLALSASRRLATLDPISPLSTGLRYTVQVTSGVQDLAGNAVAPFTASFRVAAAPPEEGQPLPEASDATVPPAGAGASPLLGTAVSAAGDLDGDGLADFVAGAPGLSPGSALIGIVDEAGAALVYLGSDDPAERITPDIIFTGVAAHDRAGVSVASDFDFNGDGHNDILIGAEQFDRTDPNPANHVAMGAGRAYLIYFDPTDTALYPNLANPAIPDVLDLGDVGTTIPGVVFVGANLGDQVGFSVAGGGLLDAGQAPDLLIGAPGVDTPESGILMNAGSAYGVFNDTLSGTVNLDDVACTHLTGSPCAPVAEVGGIIYQGDIAGMQAGFSVGFVGAIADDGPVTNVWNAAVGAPGSSVGGPLTGLVMLAEAEDEDSSIIGVCAHGATEPGALILGSQSGMQLGWSLADGRNAIADGDPDLLVGAPTYDSAAGANAGEVLHISDVLPSGIYASDDVGTTIAGLRWDGAAAGDQLGYAVAGIGDVTDDGFDDVTLGAPFADPGNVTDAGAVYVIAGAPPIVSLGGVVSVDEVGSSVAGSVFVGTQTGEHAGSSLAGVGDLDGGGIADFLVGAPDLDASTGTVYIVLPDDGDNDGRADLLDCNPSNGAIWDVPSEVRDVAFAHDSGSGITTISWTVPVALGALAAPTYDTIRSANPANFVGSGVCLETDGTDTVSTDAANPPSGGSVFYLVVAQNACGAGPAGTNSSGVTVNVRTCP